MKTILVTGGAGFIGSAVVRKFLSEGVRVAVFDDFSLGRREYLPANGGVAVVEGDIACTAALAAAIERFRPSWLCHLAAIHFNPQCDADPLEALRVNTLGTEAVLLACRGRGLEKVLVASTAAVYPVSDRPNSEGATPAAPVDIYGLSKSFAEALAERFARETGVTAISLRLFNAVGPRETNPHVIPHILARAAESDEIPLGNTEVRRDYIHTADIADAVHALCLCGVGGYEAFNVGSGEEHSVSELVTLIGKVIRRRLTVRLDPNRVRESDRPHLLADITKIRRVTGWRPSRTLEEALADAAAWQGLAAGGEA